MDGNFRELVLALSLNLIQRGTSAVSEQRLAIPTYQRDHASVGQISNLVIRHLPFGKLADAT